MASRPWKDRAGYGWGERCFEALIDFAQETGRGGRDGEDVESIILLEDSEYQRLGKQEAAELTL